MNTISKIEDMVRQRLGAAREQSLAHRFDHFHRVRLNALKIASSYPEVNQENLEIACLLHDIDEPWNKKSEHVKRSVELASVMLNEIGMDQSQREKIISIIKEHSTENATITFSTLESRILFDADKIDGLGPIGIARVFTLCGQRGMSIQEAIQWYKGKIAVSQNYLQTPEGKAIFAAKLVAVEEFLKQLESDTSTDA